MNNNPLVKNNEEVKDINVLIDEIFSRKTYPSIPDNVPNDVKKPFNLNDNEKRFEKRKLVDKLAPPLKDK